MGTNQIPAVAHAGAALPSEVTAFGDREEHPAPESQTNYRALVENINDIPYCMDVGGIVTYIGPQITRHGYRPEDIIGTSFVHYVAPEDRDRVFESFRQAIASGEETVTELRIVGADGSVYWLEDQGKLQYDQSGTVAGVAGVLRDIGSRKRDQAELRKLSWAVEHSPASVVITDLQGTIEYVNPTFTEMTGYCFEEAVGQNPRFLKSGHTSDDEYQRLWEKITSGNVWRGEFYNKKKDGNLYWESASIAPIITPEGEITHFVAVKKDITDRKRAEEALRKKDEELLKIQKLDAVGRLAGGIAHEFNNLLQAIGGYTRYVMDGLSPSEPSYRDLQQVVKASDRAVMLTRQLLGFSRHQALDKQNVDVNRVVAELEQLVRPIIGEQIQFDVSLDRTVKSVFADAGGLQQVLLNLCVNARDAMPSGGRLAIATQNVLLSREDCQTSRGDCQGCPDLRPGSYVLLTVRDNGCGMSPEVLAHVFEPFFTTKEVGKGTGLGLATAYGIVQQHGGAIQVESELGRGAAVRVFLPAGQKTARAPMPPPAGPMPRGHETILIAEDEEIVRDISVRILEQAGYTALVAADGEEAVRMFEEHRDDVSLVLLDAVMPKLNGHDACRKIQAIDPGAKIIFCTGYDPQTAATHLIRQKNLRLIRKPFMPEALLRSVREVLDAEIEEILALKGITK